MTALALNFRSFGEGPQTVLLLHGLLGSSRNWQTIAAKLGDRRRVLVADLRNHGESPWDDDASYPAMAEDVARLIREQAPEGVSLIGHSMGGKVAMALALTQSELLHKLLVLDMAPVSYHDRHSGVLKAALDVDLSSVKTRADADRQLATTLPEASVRALVLLNLVRLDDGSYGWKIPFDKLYSALPGIMSFPDELLRLSSPLDALFAYGGASDYVLPEYMDTIRRLFPNSRFHEFEGAGHWVHAERPNDVLALFESWV